MKFTHHKDIKGIVTISPLIFKDQRGFFAETYNKRLFSENGITDNFPQDNQSISKKNVLRGLHFQNPPHGQAKLMRVLKGSVLDVVVDIRKGSPSYGKSFSILLSDKNHTMMYIPIGFAHGFLTLEDNTIFCYKCSNLYEPFADNTLLWNDKDLAINWGVNNSEDFLISEKDKKATPFKNFISEFSF